MTGASPSLELHGVSLAHARLPELARLADSARPFYEWVEQQAAQVSNRAVPLSENLLGMPERQVRDLVLACHNTPASAGRPALFDGIGRQYDHAKAVYYFFSWMLRDAPQQRLHPILTRIRQSEGVGEGAVEIQAAALARLLVTYRGVLRTFEWLAVREVIVDRLEGSRRSIKGRQSEVVVRTALTLSLQSAYEALDGYGRFDSIKVHPKEVKVLGESFDVCVDLLEGKAVTNRLLIPVKTRETEGGGHSHLFTRDIQVAMDAARAAQGRDGITYWLAAFIVAESWDPGQAIHVDEVCDFAVALKSSPTEFEALDDDHQRLLFEFICAVLEGELEPKAAA